MRIRVHLAADAGTTPSHSAAPITKTGQPHSQSYVVCLDCGKQFEYDLNEMHVGKVIDHSNDACVIPRETVPPKTKVKYALLAAVPAAVVLGAVLTAKKRAVKADESKADRGARE